jgi:hypothetical protein
MKINLIVCAATAIILTILSACGPSKTEQAAKKIKITEALLAKGDTINALLGLDSIPKLYPEAVSEINKAIQISNGIYSAQLSKQRELLTGANKVISSFLKEFKPEKGEFDRYTNYIPSRQVFDKSWSRSFIQVTLNEKGDLTLASNYFGESWLDHTSFRLVTGRFEVKTDSVPLDNINNHHSDFIPSKWEKVTYRGPKADEVIAAIALNWDKKLKAVFTGKGKSTYIMWLEDYDKNAIKNAYELSKAFKIKSKAEKLIPVLEKKVKS